MKNLYIAFSLICATLLFAQVPQKFSYQTIAFNAAGVPINNGNISLKISILEGAATGAVLYTETHQKTTNSKGLVNLNIGEGTPSTGTFAGINWSAGTKFVKVELDPAGGTSYTNVGVNQLMSVPYAQVSKTVVTGAGQGITLVSPNGTSYVLNVNDAGTLNLPQSASGTSNALPNSVYLFGSYNSFNPASAELMKAISGGVERVGYKYFNAGAQIKFSAGQNVGAQTYGSGANNSFVANGSAFNITSNGFYQTHIRSFGSNNYIVEFTNQTPEFQFENSSNPASINNVTYNVATNTFTTNVYGVTNTVGKSFKIRLYANYYTSILGDNLSDGNFDENGTPISFPNTTATPKNYKVDFIINVNGTGTYTITQI